MKKLNLVAFQTKALQIVKDAVVGINNDGEVIFWNKGAENLCDIPKRNALKKKLTDLYEYRWIKPSDEVQAMKELEKRQTWRGENIHITKSGKKIEVESTTSLIYAKKERLGMMAIIRDVGDRKQMESMRLAKEIAETENRLKNEFISILAHDLKNPLQSIVLANSLLKRHLSTLNKQELNKYVNAIDQSARQILDLSYSLLQSQRFETGRFNCKIEPLNLILNVDSVVETYKERAKQKDVVIIVETIGNIKPIAGDRIAVLQSLENLISNAVKFSPKNSIVIVSIRCDDEKAFCSVRDEGQGLTEEDKANLFKPFATLSAKPTGGESSTGLGLFGVKKLVEGMDGRVTVESEFGKGATFTIQLPVWK